MKELNGFKVGDRVAVYGYDSEGYFNSGTRGTIDQLGLEFTVKIVWDNNLFQPTRVTTTSLVRLVKKSKKHSPWTCRIGNNCVMCQTWLDK